jgi:hypothetical protein
MEKKNNLQSMELERDYGATASTDFEYAINVYTAVFGENDSNFIVGGILEAMSTLTERE